MILITEGALLYGGTLQLYFIAAHCEAKSSPPPPPGLAGRELNPGTAKLQLGSLTTQPRLTTLLRVPMLCKRSLSAKGMLHNQIEDDFFIKSLCLTEFLLALRKRKERWSL
jgi:hypothetical protein